MSSLQTEIAYYLSIVIDINKRIGGKRGYEAEKKAQDNFFALKENIDRSIEFVRAKINERGNKKNSNAIGSDEEIKDKLQQIFSEIQRLKQSIRHEKHQDVIAAQMQEKSRDLKMSIADKLYEKAKRIEELVQNLGDAISKLTGKTPNKGTYTDGRAELLDKDRGLSSNSIYRFKSNRKENKELKEIELKAIEQFKKQDAIIDENLEELFDKTLEWKKKVKQADQLIDITDQKVGNIIEDVDTVNDSLLKSNKRLKGIVYSYRKPQKCCVDVILILVLIGLIVGIVKVAV